jgi:hypothetical protein
MLLKITSKSLVGKNTFLLLALGTINHLLLEFSSSWCESQTYEVVCWGLRVPLTEHQHFSVIDIYKSLCLYFNIFSSSRLTSLSDLSLTPYHVQKTGSTCKVENSLLISSWKPTFRLVWICWKSAWNGYSRNIFCLFRLYVQAICCCWDFLTSESEDRHVTLNIEF